MPKRKTTNPKLAAWEAQLRILAERTNAEVEKIRNAKKVSPKTRGITFGPKNGPKPRPTGPRTRGSRR